MLAASSTDFPLHSALYTLQQWVRFLILFPYCNIRLLERTAAQTGGDVITDVVTTGIPGTSAHPHTRTSFATDRGNHQSRPGRLSIATDDVEAIGEKTASAAVLEQYPGPTEEETSTLRKVADRIPNKAYLLCVVEFAERASYYGVKTVFSNFMQFPLPKGGNGAGAPPRRSEATAGALGRGIQFSVAIGLLFT